MVERSPVPGLASATSLRIGVDGRARTMARTVPEEVPVALVYDGQTYAVMLASPVDLEAFAVGFSLTERIISAPDEITGLEIVETEQGIEARIWLGPGLGVMLAERRRRLLGPTGCGLCGIESLAAALPDLPSVTHDTALSSADVFRAMRALGEAQALNRAASALHAAGYWVPGAGLLATAEDVGRHNALDKLIGRLAAAGRNPSGAVVITSRVSVELVHKCAVLGAPVLIAASAPTALAIERADALGITLVAIARADGFEVLTHSRRIDLATQTEDRTVVNAA